MRNWETHIQRILDATHVFILNKSKENSSLLHISTRIRKPNKRKKRKSLDRRQDTLRLRIATPSGLILPKAWKTFSRSKTEVAGERLPTYTDRNSSGRKEKPSSVNTQPRHCWWKLVFFFCKEYKIYITKQVQMALDKRPKVCIMPRKFKGILLSFLHFTYAQKNFT